MSGIVLAACLGLAFTGQMGWGFAGGPPEWGISSSGAWIEMPARDGPVPPEDRRARRAVLKWIEKPHTAELRKRYRVIVPDEPTGLPEDYDILIYGERADVLLMRLEIQVRGGRATGELVTVNGFYRGPLPVEPIDRSARELAYAFRTKHEIRPEARTLPAWGGSCSGDDGRFQVIELLSRDPQKPFHLQTQAWQIDSYPITQGCEGVMGLAHTRYSKRIERLARKQLRLVKPSDALVGELLTRLRRIEGPTTGAESVGSSLERPALDDWMRDDLPSIEAKLFARLAISWRVAEALPELRRLGMDEAAIRLAIVTADDPTELLKAAIVREDEYGEYEDLFHWSLDCASRLQPSKQAEVLLYAMPRLQDGWRTADVLLLLSEARLRPEQLAAIEKFYAEGTDPRSKVAAARCLLYQTNREQYYRFLLQLALRRKVYDDSNRSVYSGLEYEAFRALVSYSVDQGRKRNESAQMVHTLLSRMSIDAPADKGGTGMLITALGDLGRTDDLDLLAKYCEDPRVSYQAIMAIANIKPDLALEKAHAQIRKYLGDEAGFDERYFDLIIWQDDRSAVPLLEPALAKYRREVKEASEKWGSVWGGTFDVWSHDTEALIGYLKAETAGDRLKYALAYARRSYRNPFLEDWLKDVGMRLIREGADAKRCKPLLKPPPGPPMSRELMSWPSEASR